jgi:hypothetical protein
MYKELKRLNTKPTNNPINEWAMSQTFFQSIHEKNVQYTQPQRKYKSKGHEIPPHSVTMTTIKKTNNNKCW